MNCELNISDCIQIIVVIVTIIIAICSARSTSKHANNQIKEIKTLAQQQLLSSRMYLASAIYANQKLLLEMKNDVETKKEDISSNIECFLERKNVMERNIKTLEKLIEESKLLQSKYKVFEQKIEKSNL